MFVATMKAKKNIALIYFSFSAQQEAKRKNWFAPTSQKQNLEVASSLILQSSEVIQQSGFPVFHYHEGNQKGNSFGERIANAYQEVFDLGYDAVISVGNDSPEIAQLNWSNIRQELESGNCILGPDLRGGTYFIGLTKEVFNKEAFQNLSWQHQNLFEELYKYCCSQNHIVLLKKLRDVNSLQDLKKAIQQLSFLPKLQKILLLLFKNPFFQTLFFYQKIIFSLNNQSLRAPPSFA